VKKIACSASTARLDWLLNGVFIRRYLYLSRQLRDSQLALQPWSQSTAILIAVLKTFRYSQSN